MTDFVMADWISKVERGITALEDHALGHKNDLLLAFEQIAALEEVVAQMGPPFVEPEDAVCPECGGCGVGNENTACRTCAEPADVLARAEEEMSTGRPFGTTDHLHIRPAKPEVITGSNEFHAYPKEPAEPTLQQRARSPEFADSSAKYLLAECADALDAGTIALAKLREYIEEYSDLSEKDLDVKDVHIARLTVALGNVVPFIPDANNQGKGISVWWAQHGDVVRRCAAIEDTAHCLSNAPLNMEGMCDG